MRVRVIACETIRNEIMQASCVELGSAASRGQTPVRISQVFLEHGLHRTPSLMRDRLQEHVDSAADCDVVVLGYGLCSNGVVGVRARDCPIVVPRAHDCVALLLGSRDAYSREFSSEPGTYYLTPGWIDYGGDPLKVYREYLNSHGAATALWLTREATRNYARVAYIETGAPEGWTIERDSSTRAPRPGRDYRTHAREVAAFMGVRYEEIRGSLDFLRRLLACALSDSRDPGEDLVVLRPGEELSMESMSLGKARQV